MGGGIILKQERLEDNDEKVELEVEDRIFRQVLKYDEGGLFKRSLGAWFVNHRKA